MTPIHFHAQYDPRMDEFNVTVKVGDREYVEQMSVPKFIEFARDSEEPMVINGTTIKFEDDNGAMMKPVWDYFKAVADSYTHQAWTTPDNIENN